MTADVRMAEVAALVGDPARANILAALMGGRALTASELVRAAGVSPQTTSGHLGKLTDGRLIACVKQGRHRYYRIATHRRRDAGGHHGGRRRCAAASPAGFESRRGHAHCAHLLRSFCRQTWRRADRRALRARVCGAERGGRRSQRQWGRIPRKIRRRPCGGAAAAASSAARASIGPSGGLTSAAVSAPRWRSAASTSTGSSACGKAAR